MEITNQKAFFDFEILETYEAGLHLTGPEVKSVRGGRMNLKGAYVKIIGSEIYLVNAEIPPYPFARTEDYDPKRTRKLLLHKKEILALKSKQAAGKLTLIPLKCYNRGGFLKLKIALARGKKRYEKREILKRKDQEREIKRILKEKRQRGRRSFDS